MDESTQGELRRFDAADNGGPAFKHQAPEAGFRKGRRSDQAVVSRAGHDNVETFRRGRRLPRHGIQRRECKGSKRCAFHESTPGDSTHPGPPAAIQFQVGSSIPLQSLLPFKCFVNPICSVPKATRSCTCDENVSTEVEVAYDC